jgi:hypothetical protein
MKKLLLLLSLIALTGCTSENDAHRALTSMGFTDIKMTGWKPFRCSKDDDFDTGFSAKNQKGELVTGTVCSGFFKGSTVRFD